MVLAVRDLIFRVKLEGSLTRLGLAFRTPRGGDVRGELATLAAESDRLAAAGTRRSAAGWARAPIVLLDLSDAGLAPLKLLRELRSRTETTHVPVIGFGPHTDRELRAAARGAGCTLVVARSRIAADLPEILAPFLGNSDSPA